MANVPHSKDHHPEGDVWEHTLATFAHRKSPDLMLPAALGRVRPELYYHACRLYQRHLRGRPLPQRTSTPGRRPRARRFKG